jgi:predicted RNase H-like HicB family nuclease
MEHPMRARPFTAIIERCPETGLLVGHVPGISGAHAQAETRYALVANLREVAAMLLEVGEPAPEMAL